MKRTLGLGWVLAMAVVWGCGGCAGKEFSVGDLLIGSSTSTEAITLKVLGGSRLTEIRYIVLEPDDETFEGALNGFLDGRHQDKKVRGVLPWSTQMTLDSDERLYLQVDPIEFHDEVRVQIWTDGELLKEHVIITGVLPPLLTSYSP